MKLLTSILAILFIALCLTPAFDFANAQTPTTLEAKKEVVKAETIAAPPVVASTVTAVLNKEIVPPSPTFLDKILEAIKNSGGFVAGFLILFEIVVRLFPSKSPLSILVPIKYFVDSSVIILAWFSNLLVSLINVANKSETKLEKKV